MRVRSGSRLGPWLVALGGLLVVFLVANYRQVTGRASPIWDADSVFAPYYTLVADYARAGACCSGILGRMPGHQTLRIPKWARCLPSQSR